MKLTGNTVLITGGSSGIGLELAKVLSKKKNKVIICGRSEMKLTQAKEEIPGLITHQCDLSDEGQCRKMVEWLSNEHEALNVLVNNAAVVNRINYLDNPNALEKLQSEVQTNFIAPVRLIKLLYPVLQKNNNPAIVNVTTGLIYIPRAHYPFYNATKTALHAFTQVLRIQSKGRKVEIFEVMFPAVDTPWHEGNPPKIAIPVDQAVNEMIKGLEKGKAEIRIGKVKMLYVISRIFPGIALKKVNSLK